MGYTSTSFYRTVYYVPQRYFNWYTTATNWSAAYSAYPNSIQTIEDNIDYLVSLGYDRAELLKDEEVPNTYTETDILIEGDTDSEQAQKAAAFDYLTGRSETDE